MSSAHELNKILKILIFSYNQMKSVFLLPVIMRMEKLPSELSCGPEFDRLVRMCSDLSGMPFSDEEKDSHDHKELIHFVRHWCSDNVLEKLVKFSAQKSESAVHFLNEFERMLQMTDDLMEEVIDYDQNNASDSEVCELHQQLIDMTEANRNEIDMLVSKTTDKMKRMQSNHQVHEKKLQSKVNQLMEQLTMSENEYKSELKCYDEEIRKMTKKLRGTIDEYDTGMKPVYSKLKQTNEKIAKQQRINDELDERLAEQTVSYNFVVAELQRVWDEKLKSFMENRAAKVIQRAYREYRLKEQKRLRKMSKKKSKRRQS